MTNQKSRSFSIRTKSRCLNVLTLALIAVSSVLSSCKAPPRNDLLMADERPDQITDPVPYQRDIACTPYGLNNKGPTPTAAILNALPGGLRIGIKVDDLPKKTEWLLKKTYVVDSAKWHYLLLENDADKHHSSFRAEAIDIDLNGTLDWIRVSATPGEASDKLINSVSRFAGGRISESNSRDRKGCSYDQRLVFSNVTPSISDAALGEAAYCAAKMECRISDKVLCANQIRNPQLIVDRHGSFVSMTLQGHGSFLPALSRPFVSPKTTRVCHEWNSRRGYL